MSTTSNAGGEARPDFLARFLGAVPLLVVYFALAALYAWQASRRPVPTIFTDELELTQLARAIADTVNASEARRTRAARFHRHASADGAGGRSPGSGCIRRSDRRAPPGRRRTRQAAERR